MKGKIVDRGDERLSALRFAMRSAPPKEKRHGRLSLKAAVEELLPDLIAMRHKGYTDAELADMMTRSGFEIAAGTLKNYINRGKAQAVTATGAAPGGAVPPGAAPVAAETPQPAAPPATAPAAPAAATTPQPAAPAPQPAGRRPAAAARPPGVAPPAAAEPSDLRPRGVQALPKPVPRRRNGKRTVLGHKLNEDV